LITPFAGVGKSALEQQYGVGAGFPIGGRSVVLSTGMEDYYNSSYYFHAGIFQQPVCVSLIFNSFCVSLLTFLAQLLAHRLARRLARTDVASRTCAQTR